MAIRYQSRTYSYVYWVRESYPAFDFTTTAADPGGDPVVVEFRPELENRNRVSVLFRIFLLIPVAIVAGVFGIVAFAVAFASFFAVIFTGAFPVGMRDLLVKIEGYAVRLRAYAALLTDTFPPLSLG
jgi:hypothetical protein